MNKLISLPIISRCIFLSCLVLLTLLNTACGIKSKDFPELDLKDAYIITPDGKVELELREPRPNDSSPMRYATIRTVGTTEMSITTDLYPRLFINYRDKNKQIVFLPSQAFYQLNGGEKKS